MKPRSLPAHVSGLVLALVLALAACGGEDPAGSGSSGSVLPSESWSTGPLGTARSAGTVKKEAAAESDVVVTGRVKDFVEGRTAFTLIDRSLKSCAERPGDQCKTPWDYCCETPEDIRENTVLVEFREGSRPRKGSIEGWQGLDHLQLVEVAGSVERDDAGNVTIVARRMRRLP